MCSEQINSVEFLEFEVAQVSSTEHKATQQ